MNRTTKILKSRIHNLSSCLITPILLVLVNGCGGFFLFRAYRFFTNDKLATERRKTLIEFSRKAYRTDCMVGCLLFFGLRLSQNALLIFFTGCILALAFWIIIRSISRLGDRIKVSIDCQNSYGYEVVESKIQEIRRYIGKKSHANSQEGSKVILGRAYNFLKVFDSFQKQTKTRNLNNKKNHCGNIGAYLRYHVSSHRQEIRRKNLRINYCDGLGNLEMNFDPEHLEIALWGIINYSSRLTKPGSELMLGSGIADSGSGKSLFDSDGRPCIFFRVRFTVSDIRLKENLIRFYYNGDPLKDSFQSSSIQIVKELASYMNGGVILDEDESGGLVFSIWLPVNGMVMEHTHSRWIFDMDNNQKPQEIIEKTSFESSDSKAIPKILLIGNDGDFFVDLWNFLHPRYSILFSVYNKDMDFLNLVNKPDLIIVGLKSSDASNQTNDLLLNQNSRKKTGATPVIFLAPGMMNFFEKEEPVMQNGNLFSVQPKGSRDILTSIEQALHKNGDLSTLSDNVFIHPETGSPERNLSILLPDDEEFLSRVKTIISENIDRAEFSMVELEAAMGMSHAQFYRKIEGLLGFSGKTLLVKMRIQRAVELLAANKLSISEIAYAVGFSDPLYFSKVFKRETGKSPSKFRDS